jgi:hypothetical protein
MSIIDKDFIKKKLDNSEYSCCDKPTGANAGWWSSFNRIQDEKAEIIPYVICIQCKTILAYDSQKTGSKTLKLHHENCKTKPAVAPKITNFFQSNSNKVSTEQKRKVLDACVKFCAYTLKKIGALPNPQKRFGRCEKDWKYVESLKKRIKKSTKPLKDLPVYRGEDPFFLETFLSFVEQKNGFVGIYGTFKVSY